MLMDFIKSLFKSFLKNNYSNVEEITLHICKQMHVKVSELTVLKHLYAHPNFPCLLSVSETLNRLGLKTCAYKIKDIKELKNYKSSFLIQIKKEDTFFAIVYAQNEQKIIWYNPIKHKKEEITYNSFSELFTGYILLYEVSENYKDVDYYIQKKNEKNTYLIYGALFSVIFTYCIGSSLLFILNSPTHFLYNILIFILLCSGSTAAFITVLYEIDNSNKILTHLCKTTNITNCSKVLTSDASKIYGIPWSVIGTSYFLGIFISLSQNRFDYNTFQSVAILHLFTLPYILFSVLYQKLVVKQWCVLCLCVQIVLVTLFCLFWKLQLYTSIPMALFSHTVSVLITIFLVFYTFYFFTKHIHESKIKQMYRHYAMTMKYDYSIFKSLTQKQSKISKLQNDCGIIIGNHKGSIRITLICSPFCYYCAEAFPKLLTILKYNNNVQIQLVFTTNPSSKEYVNSPINIFLSLYYNGEDIQTVLNDWYGQHEMNMSKFIEKYNLVFSSNNQNMRNVTKMYYFCQRVKVKGTPTIYINEFKMPQLYNINDLVFLLTLKH